MGMRVIEAESGAEIWPVQSDRLRIMNGWRLWLAVSADQRAKFPEWAALAAGVLIVQEPDA